MNSEADGGDWRTDLLGGDGVDYFCKELTDLTEALRRKVASARGGIRIVKDPLVLFLSDAE